MVDIRCGNGENISSEYSNDRDNLRSGNIL